MRISLPDTGDWPFGDRSEMTADEFNRLLAGSPTALVPPVEDAVPDWTTSEKKFQAKVVQYATEHGWDDPKPYHTYDSASSEPGFPDLVMTRIRDGLIRLEVVELKIEGKKPTKDQEKWLARFRSVRDAARAAGYDGIGVWVWWPDDWQTIERILG